MKNNLQVVSSLLNLQRARIDDPKTRAALEDSQSRVRSIALLHEQLYRSTEVSRIDLGRYVEGLASGLGGAGARTAASTRVEVRADAILVSLEAAVPCGLVVNELLTNAVKHAFEGTDGARRVEVEVRAKGAEVEITVSDDGVGLPPDFDPEGPKSLGLQLVRSLVTQLAGRLAFARAPSGGTRVTFAFPAGDGHEG